MSTPTLSLPPEFVEGLAAQVAERAAEMIAARRDEDGWLRGADSIAAYLGCKSRDRIYALSSARRIPIHRDGSTLLAKRSELDEWIKRGGGVRP